MRVARPFSPIPLYFQIASALEAAIVGGEYAVGEHLPSEKELAKRFGVSLITVRGAMASLVEKGLVERHRGIGTVVLAPGGRAVWELGWIGNLITPVAGSKLDILSMGSTRAPAWVARRLGIRPGETVHSMRTVRRAVQRSDEAFLTTELFHPREIGAFLKKADFRSTEGQNQLVIMTLEKKCGITIGSVRQTMSAEKADRNATKLLGVPVGSPLLVVTRDYFTTEGRLVQTGRSRYRTENYEYVLNLGRTVGRRPAEQAMTGMHATQSDRPQGRRR